MPNGFRQVNLSPIWDWQKNDLPYRLCENDGCVSYVLYIPASVLVEHVGSETSTAGAYLPTLIIGIDHFQTVSWRP